MGFELPAGPGDAEQTVRAYWGERNAQEQSRDDAGETIYFLDGPPNPSGRTHLGTVWNKVLKDVVCRQVRMSGYSVVDKTGYDTHLFTTEQRITDERDLRSPSAVREVGLDSFERDCESFEYGHIDQLEADFRQFGVWMDWDDPYQTDTPEYADAAWWTFQRMYDRDNADRLPQVTNWCPDCERALYKRSECASRHVPRHDDPDYDATPVYVAYPLADQEGSVVTKVETPWQLLYNTFLTVDPEAEYVLIDDGGRDRYVAADAYEDVFLDGDVGRDQITDRLPGADLVGAAYHHPLADAFGARDLAGTAYTVVADGQRTTATGFGHGVPACDEADRRLASDRGLAVWDPLTDDGTLDRTAGEFADERVSDRDDALNERVLDELQSAGAFLRRGERTERTRQCWICGSEVLPCISEQWYVTLADMDEELAAAVESVDWIPDHLEDVMQSPSSWHPDWSRDSRFDARPDANHDWLVQQEADWGLPIPVWVAEDDPEDVIVLGSREAIAERADQPLAPDDVEPRRSMLDDVTITKNGTTYRRIAGVFADRYTAALAAAAVAGAHDDEDRFDRLWPVNLIIEAKDQPGLWFFMQLAIGVAAFGEMPFERAFMHGFLTDENGDKMSKSVGNIVTPDEAVERNSVDATRLYFVANTEPATDLSLDWAEIDAIEAALDRLLDACETANGLLDQGVQRAEPTAAESALNEWVQDRFETAAETSADAIASLAFDDAASTALTVVDETVVKAYVPLLADLADENGGLSAETHRRLAGILGDSAKLLAPYAPHVAEAVYQGIDGEEVTVHATEWPLGHTPADAWQTTDGKEAEPPVPNADD